MLPSLLSVFKGGIFMASTILPAGYDTNIQAWCGVTADDLPKTTIDIILRPIEAKLKKRIPTYASLTGDDQTFFYSGVECAIAAVCCPSLKAKMPRKEKGLSTDIESGADWDKLKADLQAQSEEYLSSITGQTYSDVAITLFGVSGPIREGNSNFS